MSSRSKRAALTMAEVLVVTGAVALLGTVVTPAVTKLHARDNQATCLSNLRQIAMASHAYAAEDPRMQLSPLHQADVRRLHSIGFPEFWGWRTAMPRAFGGATPAQAMVVEGGSTVTVMLDSYYGGDPLLNPWGAATRPLNAYVPGSDPAVFHCPADTGYLPPPVEPWDPQDLDAPAESAGIPCFDYLGNSYRANTTGLCWLTSGGSLVLGRLNSGTEGHAAWAIENPFRTVLYTDPLFYWWSRVFQQYYPPPTMSGWHGQELADNVAYCDGSARMTTAGPFHYWTLEELHAMGFSPDFMYEAGYFLRRGPTWQMDCYPAPGALITTYTDYGVSMFDAGALSYYDGWPFDHYTQNEAP